MVDLADGRVLAQDLAVARAQLGDVADQDQRAPRLAPGGQRERPEQHRRPLRLHL